MSLAAVLHLILHVLAPGLVAWFFFRPGRRRAWGIMLATMVVDLDHLLATPIYDPDRCSIGFHPLHTLPVIAVYIGLTLLPRTRLIGLGLMLHMLLDFSDCAVQRGFSDALSRLLGTN
ncbi:DUF6122 family protein [Panacagrimonas sp.]|uniref:DUF6122 family protein n=1 Tax=Panacagrimonas sp. TaxID=2480088 RepID=UPI003B52E777